MKKETYSSRRTNTKKETMPDVAMTDRPPPAPPSESPLQERLRILRESTGSATLTPNAETYVKRAAELVHNEEGPVGQRHTIAGCALRCALQECEAAMRTGGGALCGNQPVRRVRRHRHAVELASRRWRGGRRDDSARTRRKILISTQVTTAGCTSPPLYWPS